MSVRFAIKGDVPALVELGREAHVESRYAWLSYSPERTWEQIDKADALRAAAGLAETATV